MAERGDAEDEAVPSLERAKAWTRFELDALDGSRVGRVQAVFADADSGTPTWLVVGLGRWRSSKKVAVPLRDCAGGGGRVWTAHRRDALRSAPAVDPERPLLREHEAAICSHYGIGERVGRHAEVAGRAEGSVTSRPGGR